MRTKLLVWAFQEADTKKELDMQENSWEKPLRRKSGKEQEYAGKPPTLTQGQREGRIG